MEVFLEVACVAGVERGRRRVNWGAREGERKGKEFSLLPPPSRVVSRPNSLPLPFRTPATQAILEGVERRTQEICLNH